MLTVIDEDSDEPPRFTVGRYSAHVSDRGSRPTFVVDYRFSYLHRYHTAVPTEYTDRAHDSDTTMYPTALGSPRACLGANDASDAIG